MARARDGSVCSRAAGSALAVVLLAVAAACSNPIGAGSPGADPTAPGTAGPSPSVSPASPGASASGGTASPAASAGPSGTAVPGSTLNPPPAGTPGTSLPPTVAAPVSCTAPGSPPPNPVRVARVTPQSRRTTEVVSVVSDGRAVTSGVREQTEFTAPTLTAPDGTVVADQAVLQRVAALVATAAKTKILLTRPDAPDADLDPNKKPFSSAGTYVLYNASTVLAAEVLVQCGGAEQTWSFLTEGNPSVGQVNCAVEPGRGNAVARTVYANNC